MFPRWAFSDSSGLEVELIDRSQYGKRAMHIESDGKTATVRFEDGSEKGRLLIGAKGAHSGVREYLLGEESAALCQSPIVASVAITTLPEEIAKKARQLHPWYWIALPPDGHSQWVGSKSQTCEVQLVVEEIPGLITRMVHQRTGNS
jgi:2-polyprenyl-6-methoxyphenol hydroxylase-like FAD-dependent oxidoreductase